MHADEVQAVWPLSACCLIREASSCSLCQTWPPSWGCLAPQCQVSSENETTHLAVTLCAEPLLYLLKGAVLTIWGPFTPQYFCNCWAFQWRCTRSISSQKLTQVSKEAFRVTWMFSSCTKTLKMPPPFHSLSVLKTRLSGLQTGYSNCQISGCSTREAVHKKGRHSLISHVDLTKLKLKKQEAA